MKERIELNSEAISLRKDFGEDVDSPIDIFSLIHNNDDLTIVFYPMSDRVSGMCKCYNEMEKKCSTKMENLFPKNNLFLV